MTDRLDRPLRDLRLSVTDRCNFRCTYCMPKEVFGPGHEFLPRDQLLSFEEMVEKGKRMALRHGLAEGGQRIVLMAGIPFGTAGSTNVLHVVRLIGDELERHSSARK